MAHVLAVWVAWRLVPAEPPGSTMTAARRRAARAPTLTCSGQDIAQEAGLGETFLGTALLFAVWSVRP